MIAEWIQLRRGQKAHSVAFRRFAGAAWTSHCGISAAEGVVNGGDAKCKTCLRVINRKKTHEI